MKKFTLLLCLFVVSVMMPHWAMADVPVTSSYTITDTSFIVNSAKAGYLDTLTKTSTMKACKRVVLNGKFNAADLNSIQLSGTDFSFKVVDVSQAKFPRQGSSSYLMVNNKPENGNNDQKYVIGGVLYASQQGAHTVEVVLSSASNQFDDVQADWWDKDYATNLANVEGYRKIRKDVYYQKVAGENNSYTWSVIPKNNIPANSDIDYKNDKSTNDVSSSLTSDKSYICVHSSSEYSYYHAYSPYSWVCQSSYDDNTSVSYYYSVIDDAHIPTTGNETIAVGGSLMKYTSNGWQALDTNDWTVIKFNKWNSSIEAAILPAGVLADDMDTNDLWNGCSILTRIVSGLTSAEIRIENNDKVAYVTAATDAEFNRMKDIVRKGSFIGTDDKVKEFIDGSISQVSSYQEHTVYQVTVKKAGDFRKLFNKNDISQGAFLWFDSQCVLDSADLVAIADANAYYYVDLYDIPVATTEIEKALTGAMKKMREDDLQFRGLILPKNPTSVGTALIMDGAGTETTRPTCLEFIAYRNASTTSAYIYSNENNNRTNYETRLAAMRDMLYAPAHYTDVTSNTTIFSISSNSQYKIGYETAGKHNDGKDVFDLLGSAKTIIETINNEMVAGTATTSEIYVKSVNNGDFASAVQNTSIKNTPRVDLIQMEGTVSSVDIDSLNRFASGMRVLDLMRVPSSSVATDDTNMLNSLKMPGNANNQNTALHYVILPADLDTTIVHNYANLPNLKAMISVGNTHLTAHLGEAGKLAEARGYANASATGLTEVTLSGNVTFDDISTKDNDKGLSHGAPTITKLDLEKAVFVNASGQVDCSQMRFWDAGFNGGLTDSKLSDLKLPVDSRMNTIPEKCLYNLKALKEIKIPYNYEYILDDAFNESNVNHITTTDAQGGAVVDNGPNTFTFSKNLKQLGTTPYKVEGETRVESKKIGYNAPRPVASTVFPKESGVKEIYCLATKVPKCYKNVFEYSLTFGYGGQDETKVYGRERYYNNGDSTKCFTVLRYPSKEVFDRRSADEKEATYEDMVKKYTDITKVYTKKDQTGAVDANGNTILWPGRTEGNRVYNQASVGALWDDWTKVYAGYNNTEINDGEDAVSVNNENEGNNARSEVRRRENSKSAIALSALTGATQTTTEGETTIPGVTVINKDTVVTFKPGGDMQNMFKLTNYQIPTLTVDNESKYYNRLVVKFEDPVPDGFYIHGYGASDFDHSWSLANKSSFTFDLTDSIAKNKTAIDDFTIFNYWGCRDSVSVREVYFEYSTSSSGGSTSVYPHLDELIDYLGWHQIVLTQAAYVEKADTVVNDTIVRNYVDDGWFTFCIPFDMTYNQVLKMMGVPKSAGNVKNYLDGAEQKTDVMPEIRQFSSVKRTKGEGNNDNSVEFRLTTNLIDATNKTANYLDFANDNSGKWTMTPKSAAKSGEGNDGNARCLVGGRPYIIKAYKRKGMTIDGRNLGKHILTRYADEFSDTASCVNNNDGGYYEQLSIYTGEKNAATVDADNANATTMRFAKPYEGHKVQAVSGNEGSGALEYTETNLEGKKDSIRYYYTMIGQFWEQDLPEYCIYMTQKQQWKRYTNTSLGFKWNAYKCVIMATPEVTSTKYVAAKDIEESLTPDTATQKKVAAEEALNNQESYDTPSDYAETFHYWGGGFRDIKKCYFPMNYVGTYDWIPAPMTLWFYGRNDYFFNNQFVPGANNNATTRYIFTMDDEEDIIDYGDEVTTVKTIDMLDGEPQTKADSKVYSLSGQYMGTSTNGLKKGVYIVGGRKIVVE